MSNGYFNEEILIESSRRYKRDYLIHSIIVFRLAFCESQLGGICNHVIECPSNGICIRGICQPRTHQSTSLDIVTISIIVACLVLFLISLILVISIYILRRQHWKKQTIDQTIFTNESLISTRKSDYDNVIYDALKRKNHLPEDNDRTPMTTSDDYSYEPKIVYLGGDEQLTAIFA